jgi:hypothetical protein
MHNDAASGYAYLRYAHGAGVSAGEVTVSVIDCYLTHTPAAGDYALLTMDDKTGDVKQVYLAFGATTAAMYLYGSSASRSIPAGLTARGTVVMVRPYQAAELACTAHVISDALGAERRIALDEDFWGNAASDDTYITCRSTNNALDFYIKSWAIYRGSL